MRLHSLSIKGFKRHYNSEFVFSDATFLIGSNNAGKSTVFKALNYLLSDKRKMEEGDFLHFLNESNENERVANEIEFTAIFRNVPEHAKTWRGFNSHRLFTYNDKEIADESSLQIEYRKTYTFSSDCKVEIKQKKLTLKEKYLECKKISDFLKAGLSQDIKNLAFGDKNENTKINEKLIKELQELDIEVLEEFFDVDNSEVIWFENPGGIAGNVISKLPKFLLIPDIANADELSGKKGALVNTLTSLFDDVRESSRNFEQAQFYLNELAKELDPDDENSEFHKLLNELNKVVGDVFPQTSFLAKANLSDANQVIVPTFDISLGSNISTDVSNQGTGVIRSAIFALLRYRSIRENRIKKASSEYVRPLIIGFEEPEIYLHPKAAIQMRDTIYELACENNNQIIATTHSPYMIDLSKKSSQVLNCFSLEAVKAEINNRIVEFEQVKVRPLNVTEAFKKLQAEEKSFLKMLIKIDDSIAKIFFAKNVLIVEGDTEEVVLKESIARLPEEIRKEITYNWEIVKARGKAVIISLVKYLKILGIHPWVIHDKDSNTPKAAQYNNPILMALGDPSKRFMLENCIEDVLGYKAPSYEKPYKAYEYIKNSWTNEWDSISPVWKELLETIFDLEGYVTNLEAAATKE
ncbi:AAA family ATPase [Niallia sp. Marseille-Q9988]